jgi:ssDNA-binding Zn-finger/Zn-ribbon topoisomerase 1
MKIKISKYGEFLGCSNYPECKHKETIYIIGKEQV